MRKSKGESALDGQGQSVSVRGMEAFNDPHRYADVSLKRDSASRELLLPGGVPFCAYMKVRISNVEMSHARDEPIKMTRSGRVIRKPFKYKYYA